MMHIWILISALSLIAALVLFLNLTDIWLGVPSDYTELKTLSFCPDIEILKKGNNRAVLIIHEYHGTPESVRYFGEKLASAGYDIYIPAMPGAAESLEDILKLEPPNFRVWYSFVRARYTELIKRYDSVAIAGASIGGTLALKAAGDSTLRPPQAVITLASPMKVTGRHFRKRLLRNTMLRFSGVLALFGKPVKTRTMSPEAAELCGFRGVDGILFPKSVHSQKIGARGVRRRLSLVHCPVLCFHAAGDATVGTENLDIITSGVSSDYIVKVRLDLSKDTVSHRHRLAAHKMVRDTIAERAVRFLAETGGK